MELNFFYNNLSIVPAIAFVMTVIVKWICIKLSTWKLDIAKSLWSWWMPSAHSAVVTSIATAIAIKHWTSSDLFAIAITLTVIIIYDAVNVRFEAWRLWQELNKMTKTKDFKESLGHLPSEAFAGAILWIVVAYILYLI